MTSKHELLHVSKKQVFEQLRFPHLSLIKIGTLNYDELLNYESSGAPNENIVENHLNIALLNVF